MSMTADDEVIKGTARHLSETWTKLTDSDIVHYTEGRRNVLLSILELKYGFTAEQSETALSSIERHCAEAHHQDP
jgi:hypothetical protein